MLNALNNLIFTKISFCFLIYKINNMKQIALIFTLFFFSYPIISQETGELYHYKTSSGYLTHSLNELISEVAGTVQFSVTLFLETMVSVIVGTTS